MNGGSRYVQVYSMPISKNWATSRLTTVTEINNNLSLATPKTVNLREDREDRDGTGDILIERKDLCLWAQCKD